MSNSSPGPVTPRHEELAPPVPQHGLSNTEYKPFSRAQNPGGPENGLKRSSAHMGHRQESLDYRDSIDEDARLLRESVSASRRLNDPGYETKNKVRDSWARPSMTTELYNVKKESAIPSWRTESVETTPKARRPEPKIQEDNMFDTQIAASANLANRFQYKASSPPRRNAPQAKVMTPAQFERYKQDQERLRSVRGKEK
jgi:hypothetical protein